MGFLRKKAASAAVGTAAVIVGLQVILPTFFDIVLGGILVGIIWAQGFLHPKS